MDKNGKIGGKISIIDIAVIILIIVPLCGCSIEESGYPKATSDFFVNDFAGFVINAVYKRRLIIDSRVCKCRVRTDKRQHVIF